MSHASSSVMSWALLLVLLAAPGYAQTMHEAQTLVSLVPGTTLPVELQRGLEAGHTAVGTRVLAKTTQRVPISPDLYLKRGALLTGEVTLSTPGILKLRFSTLRYQSQTIHVAADAVAIANFTNASDTAAPVSDIADRSNPSSANWTTRQVGGDEVYRSAWSGPVYNSTMREVGFADYDGVYRLVDPSFAAPNFPLAMGVFSTSAHGLYGFDLETTLSSAGGTITIAGPPGKAGLHGGDHLLLRVIAAPEEPSATQ